MAVDGQRANLPLATQPQQQRFAPGKAAPIAGVDGNWACPHCQNVNFAVRESCNRCQIPRAPVLQQRSGGGKGAPAAGVDGNWECLQCKNVNFAVREMCNRCQTPKPTPMPRHLFGGAKGAPVAGADGNWACPQCKNVNFAVREMCNRCQTPNPQLYYMQPHQRSGAAAKGAAPVAGVDGNWACPQCKNVNFAVRDTCNRCQLSKPPPVTQMRSGGGKGAPVAGVDGNWACPECKNVNFAVRDACNRCQAPKPQAATNDYGEPDDLELLAQMMQPSDWQQSDVDQPAAKRMKRPEY